MNANRNLFRSIGDIRPPRSYFNVSYDKQMDMMMGKLYPVMCDEVFPGDFFKIKNAMTVQMPALLAPLMGTNLRLKTWYFFVPYRLLWKNWEQYIVGYDEDYNEDHSVEPYFYSSSAGFSALIKSPDGSSHEYARGTKGGSYWDYFAFPIIRSDDSTWDKFYYDHGSSSYALLQSKVSAFPWLALCKVYSDYFRDERLQPSCDPRTLVKDDGSLDLSGLPKLYQDIFVSDALLNIGWEKDYFTAASPTQQLGSSTPLPVTGLLTVPSLTVRGEGVYYRGKDGNKYDALPVENGNNIVLEKLGLPNSDMSLHSDNSLTAPAAVSPKGLTAGDVTELRLAVALQRIRERNNRAGVRYVEFLGSHWGVHPRDDRLQRSEFIGGSKTQIIGCL